MEKIGDMEGKMVEMGIWSMPCPEASTPQLSRIKYCGSWMSSYGGWTLFLCSCWSTGRLVLLRLCFWRVRYLSIRYLYMGFQFNGCKRSQRVGVETTIFGTTRWTTASFPGVSGRVPILCLLLFLHSGLNL